MSRWPVVQKTCNCNCKSSCSQCAPKAGGPHDFADHWRGDWVATGSYSAGEIVGHNGGLWYAERNSKGSEPTAYSADWDLITAGGAGVGHTQNTDTQLIRSNGDALTADAIFAGLGGGRPPQIHDHAAASSPVRILLNAARVGTPPVVLTYSNGVQFSASVDYEYDGGGACIAVIVSPTPTTPFRATIGN